MTRYIRWIAVLTLWCAPPEPAGAQNLGPFRQFLAIEPYYTRLEIDAGPDTERVGRNGYGGRLWINLAPFVGESWILPSTGGIALFYSRFDRNGAPTLTHYGAQHDLFLSNRPFGGFLDLLLSAGVGVLRQNVAGVTDTDVTFTPGGGVRIPIPNRLQIRGDVRDAIIFNQTFAGSKRTAHNIEVQAALGITF